ncbi:MAG: hypothetical protein ACREVV_12390 [Steroidobacteraceae bacterium]
MAEQYEALRKDILELDGHTHAVRGLALFMRQGMAVWMRGVSETRVSTPASTRCATERPLPVGIEQFLVDILATMTLATAAEVIA